MHEVKENKRKLTGSIVTDKKNNSFRSFMVLFMYRIMNKAYNDRHFGIRLFFLRVIKEIVYFILSLDAQISYKAVIGDNIRLPHSARGVVISSKAVICDNTTIYHQVTIGINERKSIDKQRVVINENCYLSVGCKVISAEVGKNSVIGANAVVFKDLPENSLVVSQNLTIR